MNENINIAEILKDAPKETELWSPIVGAITFDRIRKDHKIIVKDHHGNFYTFMSTGEIFAADNYHAAISISRGGMCVLFPSRDYLSWRDFKAPWKRKNFEPFQKVLVHGIIDNVYYWFANFYSHYDKKHKIYVLIDGQTIHDDEYIIPYEGNEDKLGKPVE